NGKRVTIPSYRVKVGDVVEVKEKSRQLALVLEAQALAERDVPDYIDVDASKLTAKLVRVPVLTDVPYAVQMEPHLVVEYYSRYLIAAAIGNRRPAPRVGRFVCSGSWIGRITPVPTRGRFASYPPLRQKCTGYFVARLRQISTFSRRKALITTRGPRISE